MIRHRVTLAMLGCVLALCSAGTAQDDKLCGNCKTTGQVEFEFPKNALKHEGHANYCSVIVEDEKLNHGLDFMPCRRCKAPSKQAEIEKKHAAEVDLRMTWLELRRDVDRHLADRKLTLMHCSTDHFDIVWGIPKVKVGQRTLRQHEAMHLYADRLEEVYRQYLELFKLSHYSQQNSVRHTIMCFEKQKHSTKAQPKYTGIGGGGSSSGAKLLGANSVFVTYWDKTRNRDDEQFHEYVVHNAVHLFQASSFNYGWLGRMNGWADAGHAHYFTEKLFQSCRTHCYQEQSELSGWEFDEWRPAVRARVASGKFPAFADTIDRHLETMDAAQHLICWSWVQFLIDGHDPTQWVDFVRRLKKKEKVRDALKEAYGYSTLQFIERWKEYVLENYSSK